MKKFKNKVKTLKVKPSRRELRKEKRLQKKVRKNEYYTKRGEQQTVPGQFVRNPNSFNNQNRKEKHVRETPIKLKSNAVPVDTPLSMEQQINLEKKEQKKLQKEMNSQRNKQLILANETEDRNIKKLEHQLKLDKRKSKGIPKSFSEDGLDFLLEVCDPDKLKSTVSAEQQFANFNDDFEEDFDLMFGKQENKIKNNSHVITSDNLDKDEFINDGEISENSYEEMDNGSYTDGIESNDSSDEQVSTKKGQKRNIDKSTNSNVSKKCRVNNTHELKTKVKSRNSTQITLASTNSQKKHSSEDESKKRLGKEMKINDSDSFESEADFLSEEDATISCIKNANKVDADGTWEDIYGRLRSKNGELLNNYGQKYVPPAVRAKVETAEDKKVTEKLNRLKKQLKGLINRLAENNMHNIATQIDELYMNNSRNDMNETLTNLILESVVSNVMTPERLLIGNVLLIAVLHANIGVEVGAHFLQTVVSRFCENLSTKRAVEDKTLDNMVIVLAQLYNFKLFDSKLMYEILYKLAENFDEKNMDCILHVLRNVGFNLRKDDPIALKDLILELQKRAATISQNFVSGTRIKFLLDILLAIKNNNMSKIPNYDNTYSEHLKKVMKGFIRKGNYVTQLNIALEDLLKANERGKWWVVGSAWTGNISDERKALEKQKAESFSQKLLELARKQRMNTDTRKNIFCIIMSAEDYLDAFEKLLHLGLTNNQDREIIHVILHCCLQENPYNPYYALLAQKFCDYDRKYQLTIKYSIWDKLKALGEQSANQASNLAKLLIHLFLEKGLSISTLKIVQFSELNKLTLRFMRQILLGIFLHEDIEACIQVFEKVAQSDKLKMFRESLRLFVHHFMLRNINSDQVNKEQRILLETRAKLIDKLLVMKDRSKF